MPRLTASFLATCILPPASYNLHLTTCTSQQASNILKLYNASRYRTQSHKFQCLAGNATPSSQFTSRFFIPRHTTCYRMRRTGCEACQVELLPTGMNSLTLSQVLSPPSSVWNGSTAKANRSVTDSRWNGMCSFAIRWSSFW
jgi:hypothetical protein